MIAEMHSFIADLLSSSGIEDRDGFALRCSKRLLELKQWNEGSIQGVVIQLKTDLFRRNSSWTRQDVADLLARRLFQQYPTLPQSSERDPVKVLVVSSNPIVELRPGISETPLALDEEMREIQQKVRTSKHRDSIQLVWRPAARPDDLIQAFNEIQPHVVHFSGHGTPSDELVLLDINRKPTPVSKRALELLFKTMRDNIRVVVLNACFSEPQASSIIKYIDCAIGMKREIGDEAAIVFAASFYRGLGFGHSIKRAYEEALTALELAGFSDASLVRLLHRKGINPDHVRLVS